MITSAIFARTDVLGFQRPNAGLPKTPWNRTGRGSAARY